MYKIDFTPHFIASGANDMSASTIEFVYDYDALLMTLNLVNNSHSDVGRDIDYSVFNEYYIEPEDTINDSDTTYRALLIQDKRYEAFLRDLNSAIIDTRLSIVNAIDSYDDSLIQQLIVNGEVLGMSNHISDETVDMLCVSHVFDYSIESFNPIDTDRITIHDMKRMIDRFIDVVAMMNGED